MLYFGPIEPLTNLPRSAPLFQPTDKEGVVAILDPEALRGRWLAVSATALTEPVCMIAGGHRNPDAVAGVERVTPLPRAVGKGAPRTTSI